jgi:CheY-like chemotaxis protein
MEMPRYFSDLDNGKSKYVDTIGTELAHAGMAEREAVKFLAAVFKDAPPEGSERVFAVSVRDNSGVIFTTTLTHRSDRLHSGDTTAGQRPVVLIVEDDPFSRLCAADMAVNAGYDAIEAGDADEAIAILKARPDIQVIFTDIKMPGSMDGLKLARYVRSKWPPIKIIATSAHFVIGEGDLPEGGVFLPKPYTSNTVTAALREFSGAI